ncbi:MAG: leucine-rich repeat domain-containing protein, partial [Muribaculaceae bacterium]|nr:leucine-rich repeat domain-containing protein [Muribaculaceae bacterium]
PITAKQVMGEAFKNCENLVSVTLPSLMRLFGPSSGCQALEAIVISEGNDLFKSSEGVLFNRDLREILWFPAGKSGTFEIPSSVMAIGENTFRDSCLSTLIFPDGLSSIGRGALSGSRLHEVVLPGGLVNIPEALFQNSGSLHTVYLGSEAAYIGAYVFDGCLLTDLYLPAQLPPVADNTAFGNNPADIYSRCVLHVKEGAAPLYRNNSFWKNFKNITTDL